MRTHLSLFPTFRPFSRFRSLLSFPLRVSPSFIFSALHSCHARSGTLYDPYSDTTIPATSPIEIDHIFPLSAAYDMGASEWDRETKVRFGNDPLNLVATSRELNQEKSDALPAEWLPPANRCDYSRRLADIARKYSLPLPSKDVRTMQRQCRLAVLTGN